MLGVIIIDFELGVSIDGFVIYFVFGVGLIVVLVSVFGYYV